MIFGLFYQNRPKIPGHIKIGICNTNTKMKNQKVNTIFLVLGAVWIIVGLLIYQSTTLWPLGFIFLIIGLIGKTRHGSQK